MRRAHVALSAFLLAGLLVAGCASGGSGTSSSGGSANLVTTEELAEFENQDLYRALQQLRPRWFRQRSASEPLRVLLDGSRFGDAERLRDIPVSTVGEVRYRNGRDATTRYGTGYGGGVLEVSSRRR